MPGAAKLIGLVGAAAAATGGLLSKTYAYVPAHVVS